jgi:3-oxoacid CoA-transferase
VSNPEKTKVLVVQTHIKYGGPKIKKGCDLPITGAKCVHTIITDLAVFGVDPEKGLTLRRYNPLTRIDEIRRKTAAEFRVGNNCKTWRI